MHEMSIAMEVGRLAAEQVDRRLVSRISAVGVEVGDRAGVVVGALEFCLEAVLTEPPFADARPVIEERSGDVLRLAWVEVEDDEETTDAPESEGGTRPRAALGEAPLPSEAGPPPGAGDGRPGNGSGRRRDSTEREGSR